MSVVRNILSNWEFSWNFILDSAHNGVIAVDKNGYIVVMNAAARRIIKCADDIVGRHIRDIIPESRLPVVLKTGRPELGKKIYLNNTLYISHRTPILMLGEVIGALAVFEDASFLKSIIGEFEEAKTESDSQLENILNRFNITKAKLNYYQEQLGKISGAKYNLNNIIGKSKSIIQLKESMQKIASGDMPVLLRGEKGTGKELFAHVLHSESTRRSGPFIKIICSALPENQLEQDLFGYKEEPGTSAPKKSVVGKLEIADRGTVFLEDISFLSPQLQEKLLKVLQTGEFERLGDGKLVKSDFRIIAATKKNLEELVRQQLFREDLYYKLNVISLYVPPLRDHKEDLELLVYHFISELNQELGVNISSISTEAYNLLVDYSWPGNVEELRKLLEKVVNSIEGEDIIQPIHFPLYFRKQNHPAQSMTDNNSLRSILDVTERTTLIQALHSTNGNKVKAARLLGISRAGLYQKLEKYNLLNE